MGNLKSKSTQKDYFYLFEMPDSNRNISSVKAILNPAILNRKNVKNFKKKHQ